MFRIVAACIATRLFPNRTDRSTVPSFQAERKGLMKRINLRNSKFRVFADLLLLLWAPFRSLSAPTTETGTLTVRVTGARNTKGKILVTLF